MRLSHFASLVFAVTTSLPCLGQYTVKRVVFAGKTPYTQEQLVAVAGLKPGDHINAAQLREAAQRVADCGAFSDVHATLSGKIAEVDAIFHVRMSPPEEFIPVSIENIVWLTPEERDAELRRRIPLYAAQMPTGGTVQATLQGAVQAMLDAKGVKAKVEVTEESSTVVRDSPVYVVRVVSPTVTMGTVQLEGVSPAISAEQNKRMLALKDKPYNEGADVPLDSTLLSVYRDGGYLDAKLDHLRRTPVTGADGNVTVNVSATVVAGSPYTLGTFTWTGTDVFSAEDWAKTNQLKPGDPVSQAAIRATYLKVVEAYQHRGYVDASIDLHPRRDEVAHTVSYSLTVKPGEVYHVGKLTVNGLLPKPRADFDAAWKLTPGAVYDPIYVSLFLTSKDAPRSLWLYNGDFDTKANPDTHTVDLTLGFVRATNR